MTETSYIEQVKSACQYLSSQISNTPDVAIILGSGLQSFVDILENKSTIDTSTIPHYPKSSAPAHKGEIIIGSISSKTVLCFSGRLHYYEGHSMKEVTFPIRLIGELGIKRLIITNASGGTNADFKAGDFVFIKDHINLFPENPLRGLNHDPWGPRFPDMSESYNRTWLENAESVCLSIDLEFKSGVYVGFPGPSLETPAEYSYINKIGGDLVGMSTVPEVITARHMAIDVLGISLVTNACFPPERINKTSIEDVLEMAAQKSSMFVELIRALIVESV